MKTNLIKIIEDIKKSVSLESTELAGKTNLALLEAEPYERYLIIKGFKINRREDFYTWADLLISKECMIVLLDEIYLIKESDSISEQFHQDAYNGNNLEFVSKFWNNG